VQTEIVIQSDSSRYWLPSLRSNQGD